MARIWHGKYVISGQRSRSAVPICGVGYCNNLNMYYSFYLVLVTSDY